MASPIVPVLVQFFHDLFTALWIGGMLTLALTVLPSIRKVLGMSKETNALVTMIKKKLSLLVYISIVGLMITGLMLAHASGLSTGFLSFASPYSVFLSIKHILYIVMLGLSIFRSRFIDQSKKFTKEKKQKLNMVILMANIAAGLAVLFLSAYISKLTSMPIH